MQRFVWLLVATLVVGACTGGAGEATSSSVGGTAVPASTSTAPQPEPTTSTPTSTSTSTSTTLDAREFSTEVVGSFESMAGIAWLGVDVAPDGLPVAFHSNPGGWRLVVCGDWACSQQTTSLIQVGETIFGLPASIQFAPDGLPVFTTPATEHEPRMPMTIHACRDRGCSDADRTGFPTDQEGWVAVDEMGITYVAVMDGTPLLRLFTCSSPQGKDLNALSSHEYWGRSVKAEEDGEGDGHGSWLILADRREAAEPNDLWPAVVIQCADGDECNDPVETAIGDVGIWEKTLDPMAAPRGGTSAFLAGSVMVENPQLVLVVWQDTPTKAVQILLDEFPGEDGEIQAAAIAIGPTGNPVVVWNRVYYEFESLDEATELLVARCDTPDCSRGTTATLFRGVQAIAGGFVGVAVGPDDNPVLIHDGWNPSAEEGQIQLTRCSDPACTTTAIEVGAWPEH